MSREIPEGWEIASLGKQIREVKERNGNHDDVPVLSVTNTQGFVLSEEYFDRKVYSKNLENYKVVRKGQFAYNPSRLNVGSLALLKEYEVGLLSPMYIVFEALPDIEKDFLSYWLESGHAKNLIKISTQGTVRDSVSYSSLAAFPILLPPLPEQKKIAAILSSVDDAIEKTKAVIEQTKVIKKGLMQELLTRGLPGRHKKFKKTPVGEIPKEWESVKFEKTISHGPQNGLYKPASAYGIGTYIVRIDNFYDGEFVTTNDFKRVNISDTDIKLYRLQANDILINRVNSLSHLGKAAIVPSIKEVAVFESNMMRIRLNQNIMLPEYAILWLYTPPIKRQIENRAKKAIAQCSINQTDVKNLIMACPPLEEQRIIIKIAFSIKKQYEQNNTVLSCLKNLKYSLMQVLLTGEMRVKP